MQDRVFEKGYLSGWTEEVFAIRDVCPRPPVTTYKIEQIDGSPVRGTCHKQNLQNVVVKEEEYLFRVDKIVKR